MSATVGQPEDGRGDAVCDSVTTCTVDSGQWTVDGGTVWTLVGQQRQRRQRRRRQPAECLCAAICLITQTQVQWLVTSGRASCGLCSVKTEKEGRE